MLFFKHEDIWKDVIFVQHIIINDFIDKNYW